MISVLLIGGGGHCRSCIDVVEASGQYRVHGIVIPREADQSPVLGYPVAGSDEDLPALLRECPNALVAIGQIKSAEIRMHVYGVLKSYNASLPVIVSAHAHVSRHAEIGEGSIVMHGAVVNAAARVAENCIINSHALIEHDARIESHCHISTGVLLNGGVIVGSGSFVGSGAVVREGIEIGHGAVIGAGQIVLSNVPAGTVLRS